MKKFLAILVALATLLSLCSCGLIKKEKDNDEKEADSVVVENADNKGGEGNVNNNGGVVSKEEYSNEPVQVVNTLRNVGSISGSSGGFYYSKSVDGKSLYAIKSYDGKHDTGAKYYDVDLLSGYFAARTKELTTPEDFDAINSLELVDGYGNVLATGYCDYSVLSDRFVQAAKVTAITYNQNDYDFFLSEGTWVALSADADDTRYDAEFYLIDTTNGRVVDGVKTYSNDDIQVFGDFISYRDGSAWIDKNINGYQVPANAVFLCDSEGSYYKLENGGAGTVYDSNNREVFSYGVDAGYVPSRSEDGYFVAHSNADNSFVLLDRNGNVASAKFYSYGGHNLSMEICGEYIVVTINDGSADKIYDFSGKLISEMKYAVCRFSGENPAYYFFTNTDDDVLILGKNGEILYNVKADSAVDYDAGTCTIYKKTGNTVYYFNAADKAFTIAADSNAGIAPYLIKISTATGTDIVSTATGEAVITGYGEYDASVNGGETYIFAQKPDASVDVYLIKG